MFGEYYHIEQYKKQQNRKSRIDTMANRKRMPFSGKTIKEVICSKCEKAR